ncbi:MAG: nicotinate-nucleotide--dimethylbenzimidazole phosphoribosyltransferase [Pseudonocardia sp.]
MHPITGPDEDARRAARARLAHLDVPVGGLGRLGELASWLAAAQGGCPPRPPVQPRVIVVAADHGVAAAGVSAREPDATARLLAAARERSAPVTVAAAVAGASVRLVDAGTRAGGGEHHVRAGSGRIDREDALTAEEVQRALEVGRALADEEVDSGADLLAVGAIGVGATTPASVLVAVLTATEPVAVVGRGSGIDDAAWMRKAAAVRDALRRAKPHVRVPEALLQTVGGADLAVLTGLLTQAAARRTPVLLDGPVAVAAAMVADELEPRARGWWRMAENSPEPATARALAHLRLEPVLDLGTRLGDGSGAVAAIPLVRMAAHLLAETAIAVTAPG